MGRNTKAILSGAFISACMGFIVSFLMNYFVVPIPKSVFTNRLNNAISGAISGFMGGFMGL